jgi:hypothetical protein
VVDDRKFRGLVNGLVLVIVVIVLLPVVGAAVVGSGTAAGRVVGPVVHQMNFAAVLVYIAAPIAVGPMAV